MIPLDFFRVIMMTMTWLARGTFVFIFWFQLPVTLSSNTSRTNLHNNTYIYLCTFFQANDFDSFFYSFTATGYYTTAAAHRSLLFMVVIFEKYPFSFSIAIHYNNERQAISFWYYYYSASASCNWFRRLNGNCFIKIHYATDRIHFWFFLMSYKNNLCAVTFFRLSCKAIKKGLKESSCSTFFFRFSIHFINQNQIVHA